jgi:hypothetical protein
MANLHKIRIIIVRKCHNKAAATRIFAKAKKNQFLLGSLCGLQKVDWIAH